MYVRVRVRGDTIHDAGERLRDAVHSTCGQYALPFILHLGDPHAYDPYSAGDQERRRNARGSLKSVLDSQGVTVEGAGCGTRDAGDAGNSGRARP